MISTRRRLDGPSKPIFALLAAMAALAAACSKAPAEAALKAADESVTAARRDGEKFAPERLKALTDAAKAAHAEFDRGDYSAAKASAEAVVADAQDVVKFAAAKKEEATKAWTELQARVPEMGDAIRAKVHEFAATKRQPKRVMAAQLSDVTSGLAVLEQDWTDATAAAQSGDLIAALEKGRAASARAQELRNALGLVGQRRRPPVRSPQPEGSLHL